MIGNKPPEFGVCLEDMMFYIARLHNDRIIIKPDRCMEAIKGVIVAMIMTWIFITTILLLQVMV